MKLTPRRLRRFFLVFFNLMLGTMLVWCIVLASHLFVYIPDDPSVLLGVLFIILFPALTLVIFNVIVFRQIQRNRRYRAPVCPTCSSQDVSFGGEVSVVTFHKSRLATNIALLGGLGAIIAALKPNILPQSWSLSPYIFAVPVLGVVIQLLSTGLNIRHVRRSRKLSDGRIRWVCETCKNEWEGLERPGENAPAAPAPLIR